MTVREGVVFPNSMGHQLAICSVTFDKLPPVSNTSLTFLPIVAFEGQENGSFVPLLVSGRIIGWGEIRASVAGALVYGVCGSDRVGVTTADQRYSSLEEFVEHSRVLVAIEVGRVREEKGWSEDQLPMSLIRSEQCDDI